MGMELGLPDLNKLCIPRRRSSSAAGKKEQHLAESSKPPISMLEAAVVLMAIANSVSDVESFCNCELKKYENTHKRKNPPTTAATKKPPRKKRARQSKFPSIPEMPAAMRDRIVEMGGYEINLVIQKQLQDTDLNKNLGRLSLPQKKLLFDFATEEERRLLSQQENKNKKGLNVVIMDHVLEERNICLKKWKIGSGDVYCLMTQWNAFVKERGLKSGDHIQLWSFRKDDENEGGFRLCFAMVKLIHGCD
ncbi:B3 domain-containing protein At1g05920-like [Benincasa hispida]|uniref:B3 domain-containing protein At1g05920-like n=1 Tax=Benincasa hispida TaxID=102211 RepID=UPI0019012EFA|nr:B3 domain-containing protein At1g05920-like [Benincasa hispida]